jgi:hypothetical protein
MLFVLKEEARTVEARASSSLPPKEMVVAA